MFYGSETEVVVHRDPINNVRKVGYLRMWDFAVARSEAIRVLKV